MINFMFKSVSSKYLALDSILRFDIQPMDVRFFVLRDVRCKTHFLYSALFNYLQIDVAFKFFNCYNNY